MQGNNTPIVRTLSNDSSLGHCEQWLSHSLGKRGTFLVWVKRIVDKTCSIIGMQTYEFSLKCQSQGYFAHFAIVVMSS
jgi:hypothetical protein